MYGNDGLRDSFLPSSREMGGNVLKKLVTRDHAITSFIPNHLHDTTIVLVRRFFCYHRSLTPRTVTDIRLLFRTEETIP